MEVAESAFSTAERASLKAFAGTARDDHFYALWTLKEAYLKARTLGLRAALDSFTIDVAECGEAHLAMGAPGTDAPSWLLRWWTLPAHRAALAVRVGRAAREITIVCHQPLGHSDAIRVNWPLAPAPGPQ